MEFEIDTVTSTNGKNIATFIEISNYLKKDFTISWIAYRVNNCTLENNTVRNIDKMGNLTWQLSIPSKRTKLFYIIIFQPDFELKEINYTIWIKYQESKQIFRVDIKWPPSYQ